MKIIFATHNINKVNELKYLLRNTNYEVTSLLDLNDLDEIIEDGSTFKENSYLKAKTIYDKYKTIVIADDSGLEVDYLNGAPGLYSARYSSNPLVSNNDLLLNNLEGVSNRKANFICVLSLIDLDGNNTYFEGKLDGTISTFIKGVNGFGYDPIFIPNGYEESLAVLGNDIKNKISHRAIALEKLVKYLNK